MARKPKKAAQQQPEQKPYDEFAEESEVAEDEVNVDAAAQASAIKLRDWRDVEKLKEERRLRRLIDDDMDYGDLLAPSKPVASFPEQKRKR